jgi:chemotaxis protein histidine kinase CheA
MTLPSLRDYFLSEAGAYLGRLRELLRAPDPNTTSSELHREARGLRGIAQIARHERSYRIARAVEAVARTLTDGQLTWSEDVRTKLEQTIDDLGVIVADAEPEEALERRVAATAERWPNVEDHTESTTEVGSEEAPKTEDSRKEFLAFAAREVTGIAEALDAGLDALASNPMDREALKSILRRQRVLLGAARLDDVPPVAQTLRAMEDISRVIGKMNVAIKDEWLDVFRCARLVLVDARAPLERGEDPVESKPLRRLRTYREELLERYGDGETVSAAAPASDGLVQATASESTDVAAVAADPEAPTPAVAMASAPTAPAPSTIDIQALQYNGEAALRRALELRSRVERAVEHDPDALAAIDEVFDLIRLALR